MRIFLILLLVFLPVGAPSLAQEVIEPCDRRGVSFPHCDQSFADSVVEAEEFEITVPTQSTQHALGKPDGKVLTLGCRGALIIKFSDNVLVDVSGKDLHVFEDGPINEPALLAISADITDDRNWIEIGEIPGAKASIDIGPFVSPGQIFTHIRLADPTKEGEPCPSGNYPGAEIDAIGAIGAAIREKFDSDILFDYDSAELRPAGINALMSFAQSYNSGDVSRIIINGHASHEGAEAYNLDLSRRRAAAVRAYLSGRPEFEGTRLLSLSLGESQSDQLNVRPEDRRVDVWLVKNNP